MQPSIITFNFTYSWWNESVVNLVGLNINGSYMNVWCMEEREGTRWTLPSGMIPCDLYERCLLSYSSIPTKHKIKLNEKSKHLSIVFSWKWSFLSPLSLLLPPSFNALHLPSSFFNHFFYHLSHLDRNKTTHYTTNYTPTYNHSLHIFNFYTYTLHIINI